MICPTRDQVGLTGLTHQWQKPRYRITPETYRNIYHQNNPTVCCSFIFRIKVLNYRMSDIPPSSDDVIPILLLVYLYPPPYFLVCHRSTLLTCNIQDTTIRLLSYSVAVWTSLTIQFSTHSVGMCLDQYKLQTVLLVAVKDNRVAYMVIKHVIKSDSHKILIGA